MDLEWEPNRAIYVVFFFLLVFLIDCLTVSLFASGSFTTAYRSHPFGFGFGFWKL